MMTRKNDPRNCATRKAAEAFVAKLQQEAWASHSKMTPGSIEERRFLAMAMAKAVAMEALNKQFTK